MEAAPVTTLVNSPGDGLANCVGVPGEIILQYTGGSLALAYDKRPEIGKE
jgi:hypothetical protein